MSNEDELASSPLHALTARVLARARELAGGGQAAIYLVDVEGACLNRLAGDVELPSRLPVAGAVGPELDAGATRNLCAALSARWPEGTVAPLPVLGRALGVIVTSQAAGDELRATAAEVAPIFELANGFTDVFERGRRTKQPSPAAEMQLELLPPRIASVTGGRLAASVLPAYDVGGDWFDHAENPDGVWIALGDAMGKGVRAAAMSAISIGALRSARREGGDAQACAREMHGAIHDLAMSGFVTTVVGVWAPADGMFTWTNCGHLNPLLVRDGTVREISGERTYPLGILDRERVVPMASVRLLPGDRLLLYSDGIVEAQLEDESRFGLERLQTLLLDTAAQAPTVTVKAIERAVLDATSDAVGDDATQILLAID
jgi:stage II sporulation SpoE-like protein